MFVKKRTEKQFYIFIYKKKFRLFYKEKVKIAPFHSVRLANLMDDDKRN